MCKKRIRKIRKELAATYTYLFHYYSFRKFISRRSVGSRVVLVSTKTSNFIRGPGIWSFNNSLLEDKTYTNRINEAIDKFIRESSIDDLSMKWEILKVELKSLTIQYCNLKNQSNLQDEKRLIVEINQVSKQIIDDPKSNHLQEELIKLKQKLEIFSLNKAKGAQVRSRVKFIEEGEKNTNYFLGMEKYRGIQNTIQELKQNNKVILDPLKILSELESFHSTLYKHDAQVDESKESLENFPKI